MKLHTKRLIQAWAPVALVWVQALALTVGFLVLGAVL